MTSSPGVAVGALGPESPAAEYVPDPRNEVTYWTARVLIAEERPRMRADGSGGPRILRVACGKCGAERSADGHVIAHSQWADTPLGQVPLRCKCGGSGTPKLIWVNPPRPQSEAERASGRWRVHKARPGAFNLITGERRGAWD
jgi:hypothetical protein